jgi:hypothetical protein
MKILVKFPTKGRKNKFFNTLKIYQNFCEDIENTHFQITLDEDDETMNNDDVKSILSSFKNISYYYGNSISKIDAINRDMDKNTDWDILLLASDDMIPKIKGYDNIIRERMKETFPDTDGVLWFNDGNHSEKLNTLSILGKKYYDRFNYIYNPKYISTWCDNEFTDVSIKLGKQKYFKEIIIRHEHPEWGFGTYDQIHSLNYANDQHDNNVYISNKSNNFYL